MHPFTKTLQLLGNSSPRPTTVALPLDPTGGLSDPLTLWPPSINPKYAVDSSLFKKTAENRASVLSHFRESIRKSEYQQAWESYYLDPPAACLVRQVITVIVISRWLDCVTTARSHVDYTSTGSCNTLWHSCWIELIRKITVSLLPNVSITL